MKNILKIKGKRGIAPLFIILIIILILIVVYCFLFIPIPAFTKLRTIINYFLIIILWITIQAGFILAYYKLGTLAVKGFTIVRTNILKWSLNVRNYILIHS